MAQDYTNMRQQTCTRLDSLSADEAASWDACAGTDNPFVRHAFLAALERTGCVGSARGWKPCHQLLWQSDALVAAIPLYLKTDSYGEFIFDWAWAAAAEQNGLAYYPKLVSAVPYTPASGPRILCADKSRLNELLPHLLGGIEALQSQTGASSVHFLFSQQGEMDALSAHGYAPRLSHQYHFNRAKDWHSFDDYTASMRSVCRKQVRKERARAQGHGLTLSFRPASELSATDLLALHAFYRQTVWEKGAHAYLTAEFFTGLNALGDDMAYVAMAHEADVPVAGALYFRAGANLYGRYWGAAKAYDALHFELCYYAPIAWGLEHGIEHFEAGAQGEHKIKRGLLPALCYSAHKLAHGGLHHAVAEFCEREACAVRKQTEQLATHTPFSAATSGP